MKAEGQITMESSAPEDIFYFSAKEIREAALAVILSMGEGVEEVLLESVNSARQDVVMGVVRGLVEVDNDKAIDVLTDVLKRDNWGQSRYDLRVRREAIRTLGAMTLRGPKRKRLLMNALVDLDAKIRQVAREVVLEVEESWREDALLRSFQQELQEYRKKRLLSEDRGLLAAFDKEQAEGMGVLEALEVVLLSGSAPRSKLPSELLKRDDYKILLLKHLAVLPQDWRGSLLMSALEESSGGAVKLHALGRLNVDDQDTFAPMVLRLLTPLQDPDVLAVAIPIQLNWGGEGLKNRMEKIALGVRQASIKAMAEEALKTL
jgi:hypothetical protein